MARKGSPNIVRTERMDELVSMMRSHFTIGAHDACAKLQCSRSWWQKNVKPNLRYAFATSRAIWRISAEKLVDMSHPNQCWHDPNELKETVERHVRIERRSKLAPLEALVAEGLTLVEAAKSYGGNLKMNIWDCGGNPGPKEGQDFRRSLG